ncbi:ABC transporter permease [Aminobacter aminovorans]|uniref:ABC transporter permease n=1 Tax=Aminobacter aminovorans TaxID=83263 RepID=UPI002858CDF7|nr:ABC transporter permease [Aminobacter aminovorans]MDR7223390.1 putative spermidine/putrescine transport system permease protein [Aminobacter aminovorans]
MFGRSKFGGALAYLAAAFLLLPLIAVIPVSFTPKRFLSMPDGDWSLRHYSALFEDGVWLSSIGTSISIALAASVLATVLATMFGLGLWFRRPRGGALLVGFALLPMVVPPVTSAIILYFLLAKLRLLDTMLGLVIGHAIMTLPFAVVAMLSAFARLDRSLEMAARNLGASTLQTIFLVVLPNLKAGMLSAWFLTFILSWEESTVTLFTSGIEVVTLPKRIWDNLRLDVDPVVASISVVMVVITAAVIIARALARHRYATQS